MPVEVAAHAGFCMGVKRAVEMAEAAAGGKERRAEQEAKVAATAPSDE